MRSAPFDPPERGGDLGADDLGRVTVEPLPKRCPLATVFDLDHPQVMAVELVEQVISTVGSVALTVYRAYGYQGEKATKSRYAGYRSSGTKLTGTGRDSRT